MNEWYRNWQNPRHAAQFDGRAQLDLRSLIRNYESFNDVQLLTERLDRTQAVDLLEVGCATGEFRRYLAARFPRVRYTGVDVSEPAIARAQSKYPGASFHVVPSDKRLAEGLQAIGLDIRPELIYSKDVIQHQVQPFAFVSGLLEVATEAVVLRGRTRDVGASVLDPAWSCQFYEGDWLPYLVLNLQELLDRITAQVPGCEVLVWRHHMVLGGQHGRFVPKELYHPETGTAETAIGIFKKTDRPGRVDICDRAELIQSRTWPSRIRHAAREAAGMLQARGATS